MSIIGHIIERWTFWSVLRTGWKVTRWVHARVAPWVRSAPTAIWYVKPTRGSLRWHVEPVLEWALPWGFAAQCGCLAMLIELAIIIKFLQLLIEFLPNIYAFLEIATGSLPL